MYIYIKISRSCTHHHPSKIITQVEHEVIDFKLAGGPIPLNKAIYDTLDIQNNNGYAVKFKIEPCFPREFQLTFTPMAATIKPVSSFKIYFQKKKKITQRTGSIQRRRSKRS